MTATLVVVDDQRFIRVGLKRVLANEPGLEVVGEASNGLEAVELCRRMEPDLVLMDIEMPEMDGIRATRKIKGEVPSIIVLVLTAYDKPEYLLEAVRAGAAGYVLKDVAFARITGVVRGVLDGETQLDADLAMHLLKSLAEERRESEHEPAASEPSRAGPIKEALTCRELELLSLISLGYNNRRIAEELSLSVGTVKTHVHRIIRKLGVSDRTQAAVSAIRLGLVPYVR